MGFLLSSHGLPSVLTLVSSVHYQPVESKKLEVVDMLATEPMRYKSPPYMVCLVTPDKHFGYLRFIATVSLFDCNRRICLLRHSGKEGGMFLDERLLWEYPSKYRSTSITLFGPLIFRGQCVFFYFRMF